MEGQVANQSNHPLSPIANPEISGWEATLSQLIATEEREAEWLDLLSQLEYVGFRKIVKAVPFESVSLSVLQHASEEASHAFLLKRVAVKLGRDGSTWKGSRLGTLGWQYFSELDRLISAELPEKSFCYPVVSWVVEQRVMQVYPQYYQLTHQEDVKRALSRIMAEEKRHGKEFEANPLTPKERDCVLEIERELWIEFSRQLEELCRTSMNN